MKTFTVTLTHTFTRERLADVLCSALDSQYGVSYSWISSLQKVEPESWEFDSDPKPEQGHYRQDYPFNPGGALRIKVEGKVYTLDTAAIQRGLTVLEEKYSWHLADILNENDDASTGDSLLQCCLFGDIIYG